MEYKTSVSNPMLVGALHVLKAEDTPEHRQIVLDEIRKSKFLSPAVFEKPPIVDEKNRIVMTSENRPKLFPIPGPGKKPYLAVFSDKYEIPEDKFAAVSKDIGEIEMVTITFPELAFFLLQPGSQLAGCIVNPFSAGIAFPKEALAAMMAPPPNNN
jgi:hypothetical protein